MDPHNGGIPNLDDLQHALNNEMAQNSAAASAIPLQATTISTIVVQGGPLQLVIAILKVSFIFISLKNFIVNI